MKPWLQTYTGRKHVYGESNFYDIRDIAHALSQICRFGGHTEEPYSVAQHSLMVAAILPDDLKPWGLLHDAAEAYTGDVPSPIHRLMPLRDSFLCIERRIEYDIAEQFGLEYPMPPEVKKADYTIFATEARDVMGGERGGCWGLEYEPINVKIVPMTAEKAERAFLRACAKWLRIDKDNIDV